MTYIKRSPLYFMLRLFPRIAITWLVLLFLSAFVSYPLLIVFGLFATASLTLLFSRQWCSGVKLTKNEVLFIKLFSVQSYDRQTLTSIAFNAQTRTVSFKFENSKTIIMTGGFKPQQFSDLDVFAQGK